MKFAVAKDEHRWGCQHCPEKFDNLTEAWKHKRDAHGIDPFTNKKVAA